MQFLLCRFVTCVYPIGTEDVITCPYNMTLATKFLTEHASCVFPVENRTLLEIVERQMNNKHSSDTVNYVYGCKPYQDMNTVIVNMLLHLTRYNVSFLRNMFVYVLFIVVVLDLVAA